MTIEQKIARFITVVTNQNYRGQLEYRFTRKNL